MNRARQREVKDRVRQALDTMFAGFINLDAAEVERMREELQENHASLLAGVHARERVWSVFEREEGGDAEYFLRCDERGVERRLRALCEQLSQIAVEGDIGGVTCWAERILEKTVCLQWMREQRELADNMRRNTGSRVAWFNNWMRDGETFESFVKRFWQWGRVSYAQKHARCKAVGKEIRYEADRKDTQYYKDVYWETDEEITSESESEEELYLHIEEESQKEAQTQTEESAQQAKRRRVEIEQAGSQEDGDFAMSFVAQPASLPNLEMPNFDNMEMQQAEGEENEGRESAEMQQAETFEAEDKDSGEKAGPCRQDSDCQIVRVERGNSVIFVRETRAMQRRRNTAI